MTISVLPEVGDHSPENEDSEEQGTPDHRTDNLSLAKVGAARTSNTLQVLILPDYCSHLPETEGHKMLLEKA